MDAFIHADAEEAWRRRRAERAARLKYFMAGQCTVTGRGASELR